MGQKEQKNINSELISSISINFPHYFRKSKFKTVFDWIRCKQLIDNAEGLWRIHDALYDFSDFIDKHPGGSYWLQSTKGTDITEAFEAHHISTRPEQMLSKYKIRDAIQPRNYTLTFKDDGFYKVLKTRIREKLKTVDYAPSSKSDIMHSGLIFSTFTIAILSVLYQYFILILFGSLLLCWTVISSHNYFHKKDNWRMFAFNLSFMNFKDWRISHAMSHHIYTNSWHDLEISMFEPWFCYIPNPHVKNFLQRFGSWIYGPVVYLMLFTQTILNRIVYSFMKKNIMYWDDFIGLSLPLVMYLVSGADLFTTLKIWYIILSGGSFIFALIGLNAAHHHPNIHHDGDAVRIDRDWGLFQLDTVIDRSDIKGSQFLVLTHFGDHALHHLFPTLDHGILPQLYPILYKTMDEFNGQLRECNQLHHIIGQHLQLARIEPNKTPPGENIVSS